MVLKRSFLIIVILIISPIFLIAQDTIHQDTLTRKVFVEDDPVVSMLDSLATLKIFRDNEFPKANQYPDWNNYPDAEIPFFPDSIYRERIAQMNDQSPFEFVYNLEVRKFIELYAFKKRSLTARILGLSQLYFPLFEEQLDKYNMPLELKYLAVIESALNPTANSRAGAKGLWQFMYGTGKVYGLKVSSYVDDRYDPFKATKAACEHLSDLYDIYGNWSLALAAYNSGGGNVNKAIRRSGGVKNFWLIHNYLPRETRSYVPAFIAASYVMTYATEHKIYPADPGILFYEVDTVTVTKPLTFNQISEMLNVPMEEIEFLNPSFKQGVIPASSEYTYKLRLRKKYIGDFINNETALYNYKTKRGIEKDSLMALIGNSHRETVQYTVKSGESIGNIAKKFDMTVSELKSLNNLKKSYVRPKQKLLVYAKSKEKPQENQASVNSQKSPNGVRKDTSLVRKSSSPLTNSTVAPENIPDVHVVKNGESLGLIASKYHCTIDQIKKWNNLTSDKISVGQKLKINMAPKQEVSGNKQDTNNIKSVKSSSQGSGKFTIYTIQSGDNLWEIADKFDVTVSQIKELNNITNTNRLKPGQKIKVPK
jgi:membrane-bound lytic murein transglycosylase D